MFSPQVSDATLQSWRQERQIVVVQIENKLKELDGLHIGAAMKNQDARMTTMEVAVSTIGSTQMSQKEKMEDKSKFRKEALESKAISSINKLSSPSYYRSWNKSSKCMRASETIYEKNIPVAGQCKRKRHRPRIGNRSGEHACHDH